MLNLLRVDFRRFYKDKTLLVTIILVVLSSVISVLIYKILGNATTDAETKAFIESIKGKELFLGSFSPAQNMGLFIPMLLSIILVKEYTTGTIRNKLASGYSRIKIYLSGLITILAYGLGLYIFNSLLTLFLGSAIYGYGVSMNINEFQQILSTFGFAILIYATFYTFAVLIANSTHSLPITMVVVVAYSLVLGILGSLLEEIPSLNPIFEFILKTNPIIQIKQLAGPILTREWLLYGIITSIVLLVGYSALGIFLLKKSDIK